MARSLADDEGVVAVDLHVPPIAVDGVGGQVADVDRVGGVADVDEGRPAAAPHQDVLGSGHGIRPPPAIGSRSAADGRHGEVVVQVDVLAGVDIRHSPRAGRGGRGLGFDGVLDLVRVGGAEGPIESSAPVARHPGGASRLHVVGEENGRARTRCHLDLEASLYLAGRGDIQRGPGHGAAAFRAGIAGRSRHVATTGRHGGAEHDGRQAAAGGIRGGQGQGGDLPRHHRIRGDRVGEAEPRRSNAGRARQNAPVAESLANGGLVRSGEKVAIRLDHLVGGIGHAGVAGGRDVVFEDKGIHRRGTDRAPKVPEGPGPDLTVGMHLAHQVRGVGLGAVHAPEARGRGAAIGGGIPFAHAGIVGGLVGRIALARIEARGEVITEAFAHGPHLPSPPAGVLVVLDGMAVLVGDDIRVLGVIDAAVPEVDRVVPRGVEGLVVVVPMGIRQGREIPNSIGDPHVIVEAQAVEIALHRVDGVVDDDLLETAVRPGVLVDPGHLVGIRSPQSAGE